MFQILPLCTLSLSLGAVAVWPVQTDENIQLQKRVFKPLPIDINIAATVIDNPLHSIWYTKCQ